MTRELIGGLALLIVPTIAILILFRIRSKRRSQEKVLYDLPSFSAENDLGEVLYVSTVFSSDLLAKVWAQGLGNRGNARLWLGESGIGLSRNGEIDFTIPTAAIKSLSEVNATIDRGVEAKGLISISWSHNNVGLVTNLRFRDKQRHNEIKKTLIETLGVSFA
jgi:hypothetical protein|tara:strand:- start:2016 stop:2504 length:489 start_codon:yes stop_codon:yes gene_type:complete